MLLTAAELVRSAARQHVYGAARAANAASISSSSNTDKKAITTVGSSSKARSIGSPPRRGYIEVSTTSNEPSQIQASFSAPAVTAAAASAPLPGLAERGANLSRSDEPKWTPKRVPRDSVSYLETTTSC